jgi:hypothetical protein
VPSFDFNLNVRLDVYQHPVHDPRLDLLQQIDAKLTTIQRTQELILSKEQDALDALKLIDDATTAVGANLTAISVNTQSIASVATTIDGEVKSMLAQLGNVSGVPQSVIDKLSALSTKATAMNTAAQAATDALAAQVPVLEAIASEGASNGVPLPPPPPIPAP